MSLLVILPLSSAGFLGSVDHALSGVMDSILASLSPSATTVGPMPRELAMRRMVDRTARLLEAEGKSVDRQELIQIAHFAEKASLEYHVSPSLIFSVIHTESRFRKTAMSPDGAIGLMQVQLETARHFAAMSGLTPPTGMALFDPELNVRLGTGYLRLLIDRFGDLRTALAAYHVGPTEIERRMVASEPFSDRYGSEIRKRETFYTLVAQPRLLVASNVTPPSEG
jgi:soluble lytic murein transglycosylase-like protein